MMNNLSRILTLFLVTLNGLAGFYIGRYGTGLWIFIFIISLLTITWLLFEFISLGKKEVN